MDRSPWSRCHCNRPIAAEGVVWWALRGLEGHVCSVWKLGNSPFPNGNNLIVIVVVSSYMSVCKRRTVIIRDHSHTAISLISFSCPFQFQIGLPVIRWARDLPFCFIQFDKQTEINRQNGKWEKIMHKCTMTTIKSCQLMFNWICLYYFLQIYLIFITLNRDQVPFTNSTSHPV